MGRVAVVVGLEQVVVVEPIEMVIIQVLDQVALVMLFYGFTINN